MAGRARHQQDAGPPRGIAVLPLCGLNAVARVEPFDGQRERRIGEPGAGLPLPVTHERMFWLDVLLWLATYADHEPDWADGCLAVLSERDRELKVWTYDREFRTTWRRPNGTAIPLAVRAT